MSKNQCSSEAGMHQYVTDGMKFYCRGCGEPFEHKHTLERDSENSDAHKDVFKCTNKICEMEEVEYHDSTP